MICESTGSKNDLRFSLLCQYNLSLYWSAQERLFKPCIYNIEEKGINCASVYKINVDRTFQGVYDHTPNTGKVFMLKILKKMCEYNAETIKVC